MQSVYIGNGASELITMSLQGSLDPGDEVLVPAPDYPLWTASTGLAGGTAVHYLLDENNDWNPDLADVEVEDHRKHQSRRYYQPEQPDRCSVLQGSS